MFIAGASLAFPFPACSVTVGETDQRRICAETLATQPGACFALSCILKHPKGILSRLCYIVSRMSELKLCSAAAS